MKIVTDSAANLTPEQCAAMGVELVRFRVTFNGKTYVDGQDISPAGIYELYAQYPNEYPFSSQPSVGEFEAVYQQFPDDDIISIHLSSGLSGTYSSAKTAADSIAGNRVIVVDSKSIGPALGWMVEIAAHGMRQGWSKDRILQAVEHVRLHTFTTVAFTDIRYLVHSGRVSHLRGIIASMLKIKPILGINDKDGKFISLGQDISVARVIRKMVDLTHARFGSNTIRVQLMHGQNLEGVEKLRESLTAVMDCVEDSLVTVTTVLGAHAGPTVFGLAAIRKPDFDSFIG